MWFKHRAWIPAAWLLSLGNLVAVWFAAQPAEAWHATIHALLAVLFGVGAQRLMARRPTQHAIADDREKRLEQAIDAIAVELERVGEGQRFVTKLMAERGLELDRSSPSRSPSSVPAARVPPPNE
jgi:steroid 5-alpha reductase family enzyme